MQKLLMFVNYGYWVQSVLCWIWITPGRVNFVHLSPTSPSMMPPREPETGHYGSIYITEINKCYKSEVFFLLESQLLTLTSTALGTMYLLN